MNRFFEENDSLIWRKNHETVLIQPWGKNSLRIRSTISPEIVDTFWALLNPDTLKPRIEVHNDNALIENGKIKAKISPDGADKLPEERRQYGTA
jgi:alpha-D-xyloside xylohydrolase